MCHKWRWEEAAGWQGWVVVVELLYSGPVVCHCSLRHMTVITASPLANQETGWAHNTAAHWLFTNVDCGTSLSLAAK